MGGFDKTRSLAREFSNFFSFSSTFAGSASMIGFYSATRGKVGSARATRSPLLRFYS